ncbi:type II secretion system F family protein, partial [Acinetobacter baumannii]|nr:type II secretion system F family protein [Acinetobacter baumannii]
IASFARTFGLLISSGVNIIESLEITKGTANNAIVEETIENAKNVVMVGEPMSASLATSKVFPPMVVSMVSIGEETGALDSMLGKVGDFYDREVDEAVESLTAAIEP